MTRENFNSIQWKWMLNLPHCLRCARASLRIQSRLQRLPSQLEVPHFNSLLLLLPYYKWFFSPFLQTSFHLLPLLWRHSEWKEYFPSIKTKSYTNLNQLQSIILFILCRNPVPGFFLGKKNLFLLGSFSISTETLMWFCNLCY